MMSVMSHTNVQIAFDHVLAYHEETKHHPHRSARSMGFLDWANQPDPFRRFHGAKLHLLDEIEITEVPNYDAIFQTDNMSPQPINHSTISQLLYDSLALSVWKVHQDSRWALRVNPSSGNLHPTEGYLIGGPITGISESAGIYHYAPYEHGLEKRYELTESQWLQLTAGLPDRAFIVGLTSIYWREAWKYGERAFRYCQHDVGHALCAITMAASVLGWRVKQLDHLPDNELAIILGTHKQSGIEAEHPDTLLVVYPNHASFSHDLLNHYKLSEKLLTELKSMAFYGRPNRLSSDHHEWPIIDKVSLATEKISKDSPYTSIPSRQNVISPYTERNISARQIIRQRRSAVAMDGKTTLSDATFYRILQRTSPSHTIIPFDGLAWAPCIHLGLFVHRVDGLQPGLYFLVRNNQRLGSIKKAFKNIFEWKHPTNLPDDLDLYLLTEGDCRQIAMAISCGQDIAADGAFSLGMIADYEQALRRFGPWFYKRLYWEAGMIGQMLYLEAEAAGFNGTGIGCFLDDMMHEVLGIKDQRYQSLYHFTLGGRMDDHRIQASPPYDHRQHLKPQS